MTSKKNIKSKVVQFNNFPIQIVLTDSKEDFSMQMDGNTVNMEANTPAICVNGGRDLYHLLIFRTGYQTEYIVHECYHCFFHLLDSMGNMYSKTFLELGSEIYAYRFTDLFELVSDTLKELSKGKKDDKRRKNKKTN